MALRDSKVFIAITGSMVVLALLSFVLRVFSLVASGAGATTYKNAKGIPWHYSSAAITILAILAVLLFGLAVWVARKIQQRRRNSGGP